MKRRIYYIREFDNISEGGISRDISFYNEILNRKEFEMKI